MKSGAIQTYWDGYNGRPWTHDIDWVKYRKNVARHGYTAC
jgi:hypothetical protein